MSGQVVITGATGLVGRALCRRMNHDGWRVTGIARRQPEWWPSGGPFIEMDLLGEDVTRLTGHLGPGVLFIHLCDFAKTDPERNRELASALFQQVAQSGVKRFFYAGSIRVYSGLLGRVDETTPPEPAAGDAYGANKQSIENALTAWSQRTGLPLTILRLGNVFASDVPAKMPRPQAWLTRILYRGMNHHLISDAHVAFAIARLSGQNNQRPVEIVNITQEAAGENEYFYLAARLAGSVEAQPVFLSWPGRWLRYLFCRYRNELNGEYYVTVDEKRLRELDIHYPLSLTKTLLEAYEVVQ